MIASTSRFAHSGGTKPVTWNHTVDQGEPHGDPSRNGSKSRSGSCPNETGSPGTCHAATLIGVDSQ
jgi:hypothetical protein